MGGFMGSVPDWYPIMRAARALGVPPWELLGVPHTKTWRYWRIVALDCEAAENLAEGDIARKNAIMRR